MVLYREPDVGKTSIANAATSMLGIEPCSLRGMQGILRSSCIAAFFETDVQRSNQISRSSLCEGPNKRPPCISQRVVSYRRCTTYQALLYYFVTTFKETEIKSHP